MSSLTARRAALPAAPLAFRLAWRQLRHDKARLLAAISGVVFACLLVFMQLGFMTALLDSAGTTQSHMQADLYIMHRKSEALWRTQPFARARLAQALALPEVDRVTPFYVAQVPIRNPETGKTRTIMVFGIDPDSGLFDLPGLSEAARAAIRSPDVLLVDERSRPDFGPFAQIITRGGPVDTELAGRRVKVVGTVIHGASFAADGHAVTSETNLWRLVPNRGPSHVDVGAIFLRPGADPHAAMARLAPLLPDDVFVVDKPGLVAFEKKYWSEQAPIGFIFGLGVAIGLLVGCVIVYQILFTDISRHIREYATLKAMGYGQGYLRRVVLGESLMLAVLGYIPGFVMALGIYALAESQIFIPMRMDASKALLVFGLVFAMCVISGLLAVRKLKDADPAAMF
jgi:putative ABC transport system permease protein